jgi:hypothetical protein
VLTTIVELTNGINWGKFMLARFDSEEWGRRTLVDDSPFPLLMRCGWTFEHVWVLDLATGEGALFKPGGQVAIDLEKHRVWVCPMFEVFLGWFYAHPECWLDLAAVPQLITLTDEETRAASALYGRRRSGPAANDWDARDYPVAENNGEGQRE